MASPKPPGRVPSTAPSRFLSSWPRFPFYWMLITSLKTNSDLYNVTNIPFWFNEAPTLEHFRYLSSRRCSRDGC